MALVVFQQWCHASEVIWFFPRQRYDTKDMINILVGKVLFTILQPCLTIVIIKRILQCEVYIHKPTLILIATNWKSQALKLSSKEVIGGRFLLWMDSSWKRLWPEIFFKALYNSITCFLKDKCRQQNVFSISCYNFKGQWDGSVVKMLGLCLKRILWLMVLKAAERSRRAKMVALSFSC